MRFLLLSITILAAWAAEAPKLPADVQTVIDKATTAEMAAQNEADAKILKVKQALVKDLTKLQESYTKKGNLDAANGIKAKVDEENKQIAEAIIASPPDAPTIKGWANIHITSVDNRFEIAPARAGVIAVLSTNYEFSVVPVTKPECSVMQIPQFFKGAITIQVDTPGRIIITSGMPADKLMGMIPKEAKPGLATGEVSAPGIVSVVSCTVKPGMSFVLEGHEVRVLAGNIIKTK